MKFILTSQREEELKGLIESYHYKFLDIEVLKKDFQSNAMQKDSKYHDMHFNAYLINKFQNNFKSSKSQFFIYRALDINEVLINNLLSFIDTKYPEKFNQFILISDCVDNLNVSDEVLDRFSVLNFDPSLNLFSF